MSFTYNGRQVRRSTETDDKKLAEKIYHKVMTEVAEGKWFERQERTRGFAEMMEKYMKEHSAVKKRSTARDVASLKHLLPFFGAMPLREIRPGNISEYKADRLAAGAAPGTLNRELALMKHAFTLSMKEWGWAKENPVKMVSMEKEAPHKDRWLTDDEEKRLLESCPGWLRDIVVFARGHRLQEGGDPVPFLEVPRPRQRGRHRLRKKDERVAGRSPDSPRAGNAGGEAGVPEGAVDAEQPGILQPGRPAGQHPRATLGLRGCLERGRCQ